MPTILITIDSLRADRLGQYGHDRETLPALDRLVDPDPGDGTGTVFEHAFANAPYTRVSIPAFQTSRYLAYADLDRFPTMGSILSDAGVDTAVVGTQTGIGLVEGAFGYDETVDLGRDEYADGADRTGGEAVAAGVNRAATAVSDWLRARGFDRAYDALKAPYDRAFGDAKFRHLGYTSAEAVTDRAIQWLDERERGRDADAEVGDETGTEEFFLWLHYMEAHRPYGVHDDDPAYLDAPLDAEAIRRLMKKAGTRPEAVTDRERRLLADLYDSDVRYCSRHLDRLFDALAARNLWAGTNVVLTSDHGEEFGEHGRFFHRNYPYDELTHVPLVVKRAAADATDDRDGERDRGRASARVDRVPHQRTLLDLAPTICAFFGVDADEFGFRGEHLFAGDSRDAIALGQPGENHPAVSIRRDGWKYVHDECREQLYDLDADPGERRSVADERPETVADLRERIPDPLFDRDVEAVRTPQNEVDRERLESLGYLELADEE